MAVRACHCLLYALSLGVLERTYGRLHLPHEFLPGDSVRPLLCQPLTESLRPPAIYIPLRCVSSPAPSPVSLS